MHADHDLLYLLSAIRHGCTDFGTLIATYAECQSEGQAQLQQLLIERRCLSLSEAKKVEADVNGLVRTHRGDARAALQANRRPPAGSDEATLPTTELPAQMRPSVESDEATLPTGELPAHMRPAVESDEVTLPTGELPAHMRPTFENEATLAPDEHDEATLPVDGTGLVEPSGSDTGWARTQGEFADQTMTQSWDGSSAADQEPDETLDEIGHREPALVNTLGTTDVDDRSRNRYSLTRVHGQGGLGQVWLAVDRQLNRQVALKRMLPDRLADPQSMRRLVKEAQITGQLEHPNIVPVYELSEGMNEVFYTMRFLRGKTLKQAIVKYHKRRQEGAVDAMDLKHLLQAFVGICNAMAFAGSKGIVHRDLKPDNVMLGSFGEVIVLDWGLAKKVGEPEETGSSPAIAITGHADLSKTMDGQILGTLGYLSPEQASGNLQLIDARTDVYGLGAILFAILTGRAPHRRDGTGSRQGTREVLKTITQGAPPEPKEVEATTPGGLNAICRKALARSQEDRYQSAAELAEDVSRWIADEPVSAYAEPLGVRIARWTRRHRTWTQAVAVALLVVTGISIVATLVVNDARRRAEQAWQDEQSALAAERQALMKERTARKAEEAAKADATRRFHDAQETVHRSLTGVSQVLLHFPGVQQLRSELLSQAAQDLTQFASEDSQDLQLQIEAGRAMVRLGEVRGLLYQWDPAREQYLRAEEHFTGLQDRAPGDLSVAKELAACRKQLAFSLSTLGRTEEATAMYADVVSALCELAGTFPDAMDVRLEYAAALFDYGQHQTHTGLTRDAAETLGQAETAFRGLVEQESRTEHHRGLAATHRLQAQVLQNLGQNDEAVEQLQQALAGFQTLQTIEPSQPDHLEEVADCLTTLANTLLTMGREQDSLALYRSAISDYNLLLKARPDVPLYRESLALLRRNVAQQLSRNGRSREAYDGALEALSEFDRLVRESPNIPRYHVGEAASSLTFGQILRDLNEDALARAAFDKSIQKYSELVEGMPEASQLKTSLAIGHTSLGRLLEKLGQGEAAKQEFQESVTILEAQAQQTGDDPYVRDALAWGLSRLGDVLHDLGQSEEAEVAYEKCLTIRESLTRLPAHHYNLAWFLTHCNNHERRDPARAASIALQLLKELPDNAKYQNLLGIAHFRAEKWDSAIAALQKAAELRDGNPTDALYLAMAYWRQDNKEQAVASFQQATQIIDQQQPGNLELSQLRDEAAELLELPEPDGRSPGN